MMQQNGTILNGRKRISQFFCLILTITLLLCACTADTYTSDTSGKNTVVSAEKRYETLPSDDSAALYAETLFRFQKLGTDTAGERIVPYCKTQIGSQLYTVSYIPDRSAKFLIVYDETGTILRAEQLPETIRGNYFAVTPDAKLVYAEPLGEGEYRFLLSETDGTPLSVSDAYYATNRFSEAGLAAFSDGRIAYYFGYSMLLFSDLTEAPMEIELPCLISALTQISEHQVLLTGSVISGSDTETFLLDLQTGKTEKYRYSESVEDPRNLFRAAREILYANETFYGVCADGLYVYRDNAEQLLVSWSESNLDGRAVTLHAVLSDQCFVMSYYNYMELDNELGMLMHTEEYRSKPREVISLAAIGLDGSHRNLLQAAVIQFNRDSDDYKIEYRDYNTDEADLLQSINSYKAVTEEEAAAAAAQFEEDLLSGVVYDCYLLPEESPHRDLLADKGLLADLSPYLIEEQIMGCIETAYTTDDGIIALPFFMKLSTLVTSQDILSSKKRLTYDVMYEIAASLADDETLFTEDVYEPLKLTGQYDFLDPVQKTCSFDTDAFTAYLTFLTDVKNGIYTNEHLTVLHEIPNKYAGFASYQEFVTPSLDSLKIIAQNRLKFTHIHLNSINAISALLWCYSGQHINYCGYPSKDTTTVLLSSDALYSISAQSASPEAAAAFMQYLLSDEIQTSTRVEAFGLPVSRSALKKVFPVGFIYYSIGNPGSAVTEESWYAYHPDAVRLYYRYDNEMWSLETQLRNGIFDVVRVTTDDRDLFLRFLDRAVVHTAADTTLQSILDEEISYVTADARSAADAAKILQSRVGIYLAE